MDLDAYSTAHRADWDRLARLASTRRLDGREADELIELYQSGATQLSAMTTTTGQSVHATRLSLALVRARLRFTGAASDPLQQLTRFFAWQLPAALHRIRWVTLAVTAATALIAFVFALWVGSNPLVFASLGSDAELRRFAEQDFVGYYSEYSEAGFAALVWSNNAWIAAQCIMFGVTGIWVPYVIVSNAQNLGVSAAIMEHYGRLDEFFLYIAPHGQLELYAVFLAAGAGLMIFWAWVAPGGRTRGQALAEDGRALFTVVIGLVIALGISGLIEGFVTRQDWPWPIKIGIGTLALAIVVVYQWVVGAWARRQGQTGDLSEFEAGARPIVSA